MKTKFHIAFFFISFLFSPLVQGQNSNFDPNNLKAEYFKNVSIKDKLEFNDKKGNSFKVKNSAYSKGLYIKKDGKWLKHGVFYSMSSGRVRSKTIYLFGTKNGPYESFHSNGKTQFQYAYKNGVKEGKWFQYSNEGNLFEEKIYSNGKIEGTKISYHSNGEKKFMSTYVNGKKHGELKQYNDQGELISLSQYSKGEKVGKTQWLH